MKQAVERATSKPAFSQDPDYKQMIHDQAVNKRQRLGKDLASYYFACMSFESQLRDKFTLHQQKIHLPKRKEEEGGEEEGREGKRERERKRGKEWS